MPYRSNRFGSLAIHHITNRGAGKRDIFFDEDDRMLFLRLAKKAALKHKISIVGYCLMSNHFHILIREGAEANVSAFMRYLTGWYARLFNKKYDQNGALFQGRFSCKDIENTNYLSAAAVYIHMNPVKAGLTSRPGQYSHSNYNTFIGVEHDSVTDMTVVKEMFGNLEGYIQATNDYLERLKDSSSVVYWDVKMKELEIAQRSADPRYEIARIRRAEMRRSVKTEKNPTSVLFRPSTFNDARAAKST